MIIRCVLHGFITQITWLKVEINSIKVVTIYIQITDFKYNIDMGLQILYRIHD